MRDEHNPLDLNNIPQDCVKDGMQEIEDTSPSPDACRSKKSLAKEGKDESGKVYECRFCSLKFCKSQALGGHMNRHRQERETETLNRARQLVYNSDIPAPPANIHPLGFAQGRNGNAGDLFRPMQSSQRVFPPSSSSSTLLHRPPPPSQGQHTTFMYTSPFRHLPPYNSSQYPHHQPVNDYIIGHALNHHQHDLNYSKLRSSESNYTCIGAPVPGGFPLPTRSSSALSADGSGRELLLDQEGIAMLSRSYTNAAAGSF